MNVSRIARTFFSVLAAAALTSSLAAHAQAGASQDAVAAGRALPPAADKIASNVKTCKGQLHPETGGWFAEKVRTGDLHAALVANKIYNVGAAYQVQVWSGGKWNASYAIIHNFDNDGICEVRAAPIP